MGTCESALSVRLSATESSPALEANSCHLSFRLQQGGLKDGCNWASIAQLHIVRYDITGFFHSYLSKDPMSVEVPSHPSH